MGVFQCRKCKGLEVQLSLGKMTPNYTLAFEQIEIVIINFSIQKSQKIHSNQIKYAFSFLVSIYLLKVNNGNTTTGCEICSKLTIKTPKRRHWHRSGVFIVNFEHIHTLF